MVGQTNGRSDESLAKRTAGETNCRSDKRIHGRTDERMMRVLVLRSLASNISQRSSRAVQQEVEGCHRSGSRRGSFVGCRAVRCSGSSLGCCCCWFCFRFPRQLLFFSFPLAVAAAAAVAAAVALAVAAVVFFVLRSSDFVCWMRPLLVLVLFGW